MVLIRRVGALAALLLLVAGCDKEFEFSNDAMILPATLFDGLPLANEMARQWSENAHLVRMGGGFAVMDRHGAAVNHTYEYQARFGFTSRKLTVNLIAGMPWTNDVTISSIDPPFVDFEMFVDSDAVVAAAVQRADAINAQHPDSIPVPEIFAARLSTLPAWPERRDGVPEFLAWRVDFLEEDIFEGTQSLVYWSTARFYFLPTDEDSLLGYTIPLAGREVYPNNP